MPAGRDKEKEEETYGILEELIDEEKGNCNLIVMGDWNAIVGEGKEGKVIGKFGLGVRNEIGQRPIDFCEEAQIGYYQYLVPNPQKEAIQLEKSRRPGEISTRLYFWQGSVYRNGVKEQFCIPRCRL